jgi:hypothetical protein
MFDIDDFSLKEYKTLECPSGSSSFVAEAKNKCGIHAIGCEPLLGKDLETSVERGETDIDYIMEFQVHAILTSGIVIRLQTS